MIENRLLMLLKKTKTIAKKFSSSNTREWKAYSTSLGEPQSRFYSSFPRFVHAYKHPVERSFSGYGLRSLLQNNCKNIYNYKPSFRSFSTSKPVNANSSEGLKLLVTAGPNAQEVVGIWLFVSAAWVYSMVVLGGITRLARSGLSMTDWKFTGRLPPISNDDWLIEYEKYKQSLENKRVNNAMSLDDFKLTYWMEYAHRLWGRSLAIMIAVPFSYFLLKGYITLRLGLRLSGLCALGAGQGLVGWITVKSGLEEPTSEHAEPRVSLFRFAAHTTSAFVFYSGLFSTALSVVMPEPPVESTAWIQGAAKIKRLVLPVTLLVGITAILGAYVAENDAGSALDTPKMGDAWVLEDIFVLQRHTQNFLDNLSVGQLVHGILTTASLFIVGGLWWSTRKIDIHPAIRPLIGSTIGIAMVQVSLGTTSLLSYVPISLGTAHQGGTLTLLTLILILNHIVRRGRPSLRLKNLLL